MSRERLDGARLVPTVGNHRRQAHASTRRRSRRHDLIEKAQTAGPLAQTTAVLHGATAVVMGLTLLTWTPDRSPQWLLVAYALSSLLVTALVLLRGARLSTVEFVVITGLLMLGLILLTSFSPTDLGALANGAVLPVLSLYVMWFMPNLGGRVLLYGGGACWFAAIVLRDEPLLTGLAVTLLGQVILAAEVLAWVHARAEKMARVDELTGAVNRRAIVESCGFHLARLHDRGTAFSIISIDLDGLRSLNNSQGHIAGDALLERACRHWESQLRSHDVLGRVGGDEFVIILPGATALEAFALKRRLRVGATVSWSAGVAQARADDDLATLMHRADQRMYRQKAERAAAG